MQQTSGDKTGGMAIITGSILLTIYSALFTVVLPIHRGAYDFVQVVQNPNWTRLASVALFGVLLMMIVYDRLRASSRWLLVALSSVRVCSGRPQLIR